MKASFVLSGSKFGPLGFWKINGNGKKIWEADIKNDGIVTVLNSYV
jgi:hypothetical protein